jgi:cell fate regulator YaaT (PSP1 superfamily)
MLPPGGLEVDNVYEVKFKATRKAFYRNINNLDIITGDYVIVESDRGFDVGMVTMGGELARLQMRKKKVTDKEVLRIIRLATEEEVKLMQELRTREPDALIRSRAIVATLQMDMKLTDVEYQGDGTKMLFHYIAEQRVDFRELIKQLANEIKVRVEMRQIGVRQEAGLVGGVGSCGRELCCSTFLTDFRTVNTNAARYQNLSLNPAKITGLCGRLKCCLNYELDTYMDALKFIPQINQIKTETGVAYLQKTDIFKRKMWFAYPNNSNWTELTVEEVVNYNEMNKRGELPPALSGAALEEKSKQRELDFVEVGGDSRVLERLDAKRKQNKKRKGGDPRQQNMRQQGPPQVRPNRPEGGRPDGPRPQRPEGQRPQQQGPRPDGPRPQRPEGRRPQHQGPRPDGPRPQRPEGQRPPQQQGPRPEGPRPPQGGSRQGPPPPAPRNPEPPREG